MPPNSGRGDVGRALGYQLAVGAVAPAGHAVGDHGREQALDAAEQREGERGRQHGRQFLDRQLGQMRGRQRSAGCRRSGCRWSRPAGRAAKPAIAATPTAIRKAGQCGRHRRRPRITPMASAATATAAGLTVGSASTRAPSLGTSGPGSLPSSVRPSSSLSWLAKMMMAMPEVNPTVTGIGNVLDESAEPQRSRLPARIRRRKAWSRGSARRSRAARPSRRRAR